jgi:hypothetical protein
MQCEKCQCEITEHKKFEQTHSNCQEWKKLAEKAQDALKELLMHGCAVPDKDGNPIPYQADPDFARQVIDEIDRQKEDKI